MSCEPGELLLVPFPFSDLSTTKRRPVLALTAPDDLGDFIGMAVTSRPHRGHALAIGAEDLESGILPVSSWIRTDRVITLNESLIAKSIGNITDDLRSQAVRRLCERLGDS